MSPSKMGWRLRMWSAWAGRVSGVVRWCGLAVFHATIAKRLRAQVNGARWSRTAIAMLYEWDLMPHCHRWVASPTAAGTGVRAGKGLWKGPAQFTSGQPVPW